MKKHVGILLSLFKNANYEIDSLEYFIKLKYANDFIIAFFPSQMQLYQQKKGLQVIVSLIIPLYLFFERKTASMFFGPLMKSYFVSNYYNNKNME